MLANNYTSFIFYEKLISHYKILNFISLLETKILISQFQPVSLSHMFVYHLELSQMIEIC